MTSPAALLPANTMVFHQSLPHKRTTSEPHAPPATLLTFADATNAATMHPMLPLLAVATGERRFPLPASDASDGDAPESEAQSERPPAIESASINGLSVWRMPWSSAGGTPTALPELGE